MFKFLKIIIFSFLLFGAINFVQAAEVKVYFFHGDGCPHCAAEEEFFEELEKTTDLDFEVEAYEIWKNPQNAKLLRKIALENNWNPRGVPFTVIGNETISGFNSAQTTGKLIQAKIEKCQEYYCEDIVGGFLARAKGEKEPKKIQENVEANHIPKTIALPLLGEIETKDFSLPILTIIIGGIDGFNPCAMWVLIFLIGLLLGMKDRKRRWVLGGAFIAASAGVYFLFLAAWLELFNFLQIIPFIKPLIGIVALAAGGFHIREYFTNPEAACKVTSGKKRQLVFEKLKKFVHERSFFLALFGIIVLAAAVNLVELVCSAGLPAVFTQILASSDLSFIESYSYMLLYVIIFMLDDMLVFAIAMRTLEIKSVGSKYSRVSFLVGGIIMLILGALLIFKPGLLAF